MNPLMVDSPRPAASWVSSLPGDWLTPKERLVLLVLACDARPPKEGESATVSRPGGGELAEWCGLINGRLYEVLAALAHPTELRPALIQRVDKFGAPIPDGKRYGGRDRTGYRLCLEVHQSSELSHPTGRVTEWENTPDWLGELGTEPEYRNSPESPGENASETLPGNSPGKLSRETLPAGRETLFSSLLSATQVSDLRTDRAPEVPDDCVESSATEHTPKAKPNALRRRPALSRRRDRDDEAHAAALNLADEQRRQADALARIIAEAKADHANT